VDGAFGLWAAASEDFARLTAGCDLAHSWALDAHKWLNVSYDCGIALVRDVQPLAAAMKISGSYYGWTNDRFDAMRLSIESSRRARGIELWATVRSLGQSGIRDLLRRTHDLAVRFAGLLWDGGFQLLNDICINQVLATVDAPRSAITDLVKAVQDEGVCWIGETVWKGRPAFRISVSSWATTSQDVDRSAESIIRLARQRGLLGS
jgi:glutamate/tyrosine decarboxylase-like PLP-dependent enzyme